MTTAPPVHDHASTDPSDIAERLTALEAALASERAERECLGRLVAEAIERLHHEALGRQAGDVALYSGDVMLTDGDGQPIAYLPSDVFAAAPLVDGEAGPARVECTRCAGFRHEAMNPDDVDGAARDHLATAHGIDVGRAGSTIA